MFRIRLAAPWRRTGAVLVRGSRGNGRGWAPGGEGWTPPPDFGGAAFRLKPLSQILRALLVFRFCSHPLLVRNSAQLMAISRRVLGKWLFDRMMRLTAYGQFVAGETLPEINETIRNLAQLGIRPLLAVPIEEDIGDQTRDTETWYNQNLQTMLNCVDLSAGNCPQPMMQLKITALMSAELCRTVTCALQDKSCAQDIAVHRLVEVMDGKELTFTSLSDRDAVHFCHSLRRLEKIGQYAADRGVRILVDAEYRSLNPAISLLTMALVTRFNSHQALVWNTYQCYLKETLGNLVADMEWARSLSLTLGVKLVRGAYMDRERDLAQRLGYPDPIHSSWADTNRSYHQALDVMLETLREAPRHRVIIATHNLPSVSLAMARMEKLGIPRNQETVCFAQLLGMCDHISIGLGQAGYCVYKSIPYGPVEDVLPYLTRRAQENHTVLDGLRMERELLWQELRRRLFGKRGLRQ